jgi:hypothetical protein
VLDTRGAAVVDVRVDLEAFAREQGALRGHERIELP